MTNVAILTPVLTHADAVGHDVIGMHAALNRAGFRAEIFAETGLVEEPAAQPLEAVAEFLTDPADILIYHYSIGWEAGLKLLQELNCHKIIRYHNVTPPEFYENISVDYMNACQSGREQLKQLIPIQDLLYLCASDYNLSDLQSIGIQPKISGVLPPFHCIEKLRSLAADLSILDQYLDSKFNILMVGRIAPNKGHLMLLEAFHLYQKTYNPESRLLIVGKEDARLETYNRVLHQRVEELGLQESVVFTGGVSIESLKAYYLLANAFLLTSEHEGFCVPLVEAMSRKIPIVAYGSSAIPATVGSAGLVWEQRNPYLLAGSLHKIATSPNIQIRLGELGWQRYQTVFRNEQIEAQLLQFIEPLTQLTV